MPFHVSGEVDVSGKGGAATSVGRQHPKTSTFSFSQPRETQETPRNPAMSLVPTQCYLLFRFLTRLYLDRLRVPPSKSDALGWDKLLLEALEDTSRGFR